MRDVRLHIVRKCEKAPRPRMHARTHARRPATNQLPRDLILALLRSRLIPQTPDTLILMPASLPGPWRTPLRSTPDRTPPPSTDRSLRSGLRQCPLPTAARHACSPLETSGGSAETASSVQLADTSAAQLAETSAGSAAQRPAETSSAETGT